MRAKLDLAVARVTSGLALVGAIAVVAMLLHVTAYVLMRHVMSAPVPATVEIVSRYYMVAIAFLPLAWAERRGDMISIEVFAHLTPQAIRPWVGALVSLVTFGAYVLLTYTTFSVALRELTTRSFVISLSVAIPVWPGYFILPVGFALAALVCLYRFFTLLFPSPGGEQGEPS